MFKLLVVLLLAGILIGVFFMGITMLMMFYNSVTGRTVKNLSTRELKIIEEDDNGNSRLINKISPNK